MDIEKIKLTLQQRLHYATIRKVYGTLNFDSVMYDFAAIGNEFLHGKFVIDETNRFVYENCVKWLIGHPFQCIEPESGKTITGNHYKGLYIGGNCGTGKSLLLKILDALSAAYGIYYTYAEKDIKMVWKQRRADKICGDFITKGMDAYDILAELPILCINDFGSGTNEQLYMGNRINIIKQLLEDRADNAGKFTLITSNYKMTDNEIKADFGDRVCSRLKEMCNYFELVGKDRRQ